MYTRRLNCMDTLKEMNLSKDEFLIYGSAPMVLRGIKEKNNDLDVLVKNSLWQKLKIEYPNNISGDYINVGGISFTNKDMNFLGNIDEVMKKSDIIDGYHILNLETTMEWKRKLGGERHLKDATIIENYLANLEKKL